MRVFVVFPKKNEYRCFSESGVPIESKAYAWGARAEAITRFMSQGGIRKRDLPNATAKVQKKIDISDAKFSAAFFVAFGWANQSLDS